jgi:hypothetical protein
MFRQRADDPAVSALRQDDARHSIEVLRAIQAMANQLAGFDFHSASPNQQSLTLGGVEVSVRVDLVIHGATRDREQIGAAILRMTQDDADTESARARRQEMGFYVATLARLHLEANLALDGREPANRLCLSIDVQHGESFACPASNTRRWNNLENACRFIAAMWREA